MPPRSAVNLHATFADVAACRAMLRGGSKTFFAASLALPGSIREPATGLYAFCRMADDAIDHGVDRAAALHDLHVRLERIYAGAPRDMPADRSFADCVARFAIPRKFPLALLEGFAWDAAGRRYRDLSALKAYGVRVAGTVGAMMAMVMSVREPELIARACDLGVAMQLTNIARDVGEDARSGRLYLPLDWLSAAGIDPDEWLANPRHDARLASVIARFLREADTLYLRSDSGLANLPSACRPGMVAARLLYAEIGREVARHGHDSVNRRAIVPWRRKARLLANAVLTASRNAPLHRVGLLDEAMFLMQSLPAVPEGATLPERSVPEPFESAREKARWPAIEDRVAWLVDLFERLERRDAGAADSARAS